jgi:hypothetical protein
MFGWQLCTVGGVEQFFMKWSAPKDLFGTALLHRSQLSFMNFTAEQLSFEVAEFLKVFG